jgi:hypothetical protein
MQLNLTQLITTQYFLLGSVTIRNLQPASAI